MENQPAFPTQHANCATGEHCGMTLRDYKQMNWTRVTRRNPCPICEKPDWCVFSPNQCLVRCMRVESQWSTKNGGWLHPIGNRHIPYIKPRKYVAQSVPMDCNLLLAEWRQHQNGELEPFAATLGVSQVSLWALGCLYAPEHRAFAFPMYNAKRRVIGIRLRNDRGDKWAVKGSKQGLFLNLSGADCTHVTAPPTVQTAKPQGDITASAQNNLPVPVLAEPSSRIALQRTEGGEARESTILRQRKSSESVGEPDSRGGQTSGGQSEVGRASGDISSESSVPSARTLLIVEGPTDAAAAIDLGYNVIGRPACVGCEDMIAELSKGYPGALFIIADNDGPGQRGARALQGKIGRAKVVTLPTKDLRKFLQIGGTKEILNAIMFAAV